MTEGDKRDEAAEAAGRRGSDEPAGAGLPSAPAPSLAPAPSSAPEPSRGPVSTLVRAWLRFWSWQDRRDAPAAERIRRHDEAARGKATRRRAWRRFGLDQFEMRDAILPTVLVHVGLLVFAPIAVSIFGSEGARAVGPLDIWNHWDGPHFLEVAARGYDPTGDPARAVLFPLYPVLIRLGSFVLDPLRAAMAISFVASVAASVGLYRLVWPGSGRAIARNSVLAFCIFPTAYAFVAPYSQAPFVAFTLWAFVAARNDQWGRAGVLGMLAALTRLEGAFLLPALGIEYLVRRRGRIGLDSLRILLVALGPLIFLGINAYAYGSPFFFLDQQKTTFHVQTVAPWDMLGPLAHTVFAGGSGEYWVTVFLAPLVAFGLLAAVAAWSLLSRHSRLSWAAVTWLNLVSLVTLSWPISVPRYLLDAFPIFVAGGWLGRHKSVGGALATLSVLLLGAFTTLFALGHWAF